MIDDNISNKFSVLCNEDGVLTKKVFLNENGEIEKEAAGNLVNGFAFIQELNFSEFPMFLRTLNERFCIAHGIYNDKKYGKSDGFVDIVVKEVKSGKYPTKDGIIARIKDYFLYPKYNALTMFDYDVDPGDIALSTKEYINILSSVIPGFDSCAKVVTPSTSSFLYYVGGNVLIGESSSLHLYFIVKESADIRRFVEVLEKRFWLAGYGKIKLSSLKEPLLRTIFDTAVFSPERLDFVSGAHCEDGIVQKLPDPEYYPGGVLDTTKLESLTPEEEVECSRLKKQAMAPYLHKYEVYKKERAKKVASENGWSEKRAFNFIQDGDKHVLWNDHVLKLADGSKIKVGDLLDDGLRYDGVILSDPLEQKKRGKAKFFWNEGKNPQISSFAHGGTRYSFKRYQFKGGRIYKTDKNPTFGGSHD